YFPIVEFKTQKLQPIRFRSKFGSHPPSYHIGEAVPMLYDAVAPNRAEINSFSSLWFTTIFFSAMGSAFFGTGLTMMIVQYMRAHVVAYLRRCGKPVTTQFVDVEINEQLSVRPSANDAATDAGGAAEGRVLCLYGRRSLSLPVPVR